MQLGGNGVSLRPVPTCVVREEHEEKRVQAIVHTTFPGPVGPGCPMSLFLLHPLPEDGLSMLMCVHSLTAPPFLEPCCWSSAHTLDWEVGFNPWEISGRSPC